MRHLASPARSPHSVIPPSIYIRISAHHQSSVHSRECCEEYLNRTCPTYKKTPYIGWYLDRATLHWDSSTRYKQIDKNEWRARGASSFSCSSLIFNLPLKMCGKPKPGTWVQRIHFYTTGRSKKLRARLHELSQENYTLNWMLHVFVTGISQYTRYRKMFCEKLFSKRAYDQN